MSIIIPDFEWYSNISQERGISPRCQFQMVDQCPRYYQSLSLLKLTGATSIEVDKDESLFKRWKESPLWPLLGEQETSVLGTSDSPDSIISNFCPEVIYVRFNLFASFLARYADTLDLESAHERLGKQGVSSNDWRWVWSSIRPMHYSECPLYSILLHKKGPSVILSEAEDLFEFKPGIFGISLNLKELLTRFCIWWLNRVKRKSG